MGIDWIRIVSCCLILCGTQLFAQSELRGNAPAGKASALEASVGYVFMSMTSAETPRLNLGGVDANSVLQFAPRWGAMVDLAFARATNVPGTGHSDKVFSALAGPECFLIDRTGGNVFVHGLAGVALVDSAFLAANGFEFHGYAARFSYALGAGAEVTVHGPFAVRLTGDYQRTGFVNSVLGSVPQNNLRLGTSLVYRLGSRAQ
jgi:opacity protein-like surface antigen